MADTLTRIQEIERENAELRRQLAAIRADPEMDAALAKQEMTAVLAEQAVLRRQLAARYDEQVSADEQARIDNG